MHRWKQLTSKKDPKLAYKNPLDSGSDDRPDEGDHLSLHVDDSGGGDEQHYASLDVDDMSDTGGGDEHHHARAFLDHKLSAAASKDMLGLMKKISPESAVLKDIKFETLWNIAGKSSMTEVHYCELCNTVFPDDLEQYRCATHNCPGLRYLGALPKQTQKGRRPRKFFVVADVAKQLTNILEAEGVWEAVQTSKVAASERNDTTVRDVTDGSCYRQLFEDGGFLSGPGNCNITVIANTDGLNLYQSSRVELWPIFLTINELEPQRRFSRQNIVLAGIWQGTGKPPFEQFMGAFTKEMNKLYTTGFQFVVDDQTVTAKLAVLCATVDLPAKAGIMNMTLFNGADACITCKEPGLVVRQGKGHARSYPYREAHQRYATRLHVDVLAAMHTATPKKRVQGFKGVSGLSELQQFDLVHGVVPEYMHGILLGVTKTVMNKWFSPTESGQPYFVGKKLKEISKRLQHIQPPDFIERLPRDLELHYNHLKATEFQMWLLFYALPCLDGILGDKYLCHFAHLSEAVHILLGDKITAESLEIAASLLDIFYKDFADCYGAGSCGINVHNAGVHLVSCVRQWGPLWAWSCFCFEDANAMILQAVHGTGDVTKQVIRFKETQGVLNREGGTITDRTNWSKVNMVQANCGTAGALKPMSASSELLVKTGASTSAVLRKALRVKLEHQKLYSEEYLRMRRRVCHVAVLDDGREFEKAKKY
ncbi:hypothetical protein KUCAC02_016521 [Chaenocephalus aceratus]|nr:hypothetical protein KUCAC02_016521 [Chaenocephalus aceratus]